MRRSPVLLALLIALPLVPRPASGQDQTTSGPSAATPPPTATPPPSTPSDPDADPALAPLWQVYYDRGIKAMRNKDNAAALKELGKAKAELAKHHAPDKRKSMAEINTQLGCVLLELGKNEKHSYIHENQLMSAKHHFAWARNDIEALHGRDSLEFADATERQADARSTYAEYRAGDLRYFLSALSADFTTQETPADLYILALHIREQCLGESAKAVMTYRRKVTRTLYGWVRTARNLRKDITDVKAEYEYDPIIQGWKECADELKQRDRDLKRRNRDNPNLDSPNLDNPDPDNSDPDDSSTDGNE